MNTRKRGSMGAVLEAGYHTTFWVFLAKVTNIYKLLLSADLDRTDDPVRK